MSLVDYGHRGVPNVFLSAPLLSRRHLERGALQEPGLRQAGQRTTSRRVDLQTQQKLAGEIQQLLLDETPIIFAYFYNFLTATRAGVTGVRTTAIEPRSGVDQADRLA